MSVQRLGTYIEQYSQKNKNDEPYPVYSVTNSDGFCTEYFNKDVSGKNKTNYKIVPKGYFAYNPSRINVGSIDWQNSEDNVIVSPIYVVFKCLNGLNQDYLKYFIKSSEGIRMINSKVSGAVRNNLRFEDLSEFEFNIVDYDKQLEVVNTLRLIEKAIKNEKHQLELLDEFIKARFVELFDSIYDNKNGYEVMTLQDVCEPIKDGTHQTPTYTEDTVNGYKFLSSKDVSSGKVDWTHLKYIPEDLHNDLYKRISPKKGDILLAKNGTTGVAAVVDRDEVFDIYVSLALLRPLEMVTSEYLCSAVNSIETKHQFDSSLKGIGVPNLHLGEIKKTKIVVPPIEVQEEFAEFVKQVDKSKVVVQERLEKYEELLEKKLYEYFIV